MIFTHEKLEELVETFYGTHGKLAVIGEFLVLTRVVEEEPRVETLWAPHDDDTFEKLDDAYQDIALEEETADEPHWLAALEQVFEC